MVRDIFQGPDELAGMSWKIVRSRNNSMTPLIFPTSFIVFAGHSSPPPKPVESGFAGRVDLICKLRQARQWWWFQDHYYYIKALCTALVGQKFPFGICWLSVRVRSGVGGPGPRKSRLVSNNTESRLPEKAVPSQSIQMSITSNETHHICTIVQTERVISRQTDRHTNGRK